MAIPSAGIAARRVRLGTAFRQAIYVVRRQSEKPIARTGFFGMPRIKPEHEKCVFFLLAEGSDEPKGTGFIVTRTTMNGASVHLYGITNHHVAIGGYAQIVSVNTKAGPSRPIPTQEDQWQFSHADDLAAIDLTDLLIDEDDFMCIPEGAFANRSFVERAAVAIGDEVFLVGLFSSHSGRDATARQGDRKRENIASGRFGSLSILASDEAPIAGIEGYPPRPRFVADMRSRPGYSGSPVFVYRTVFVDLRNFEGNSYRVDLGMVSPADEPDFDTFVRLLGVHCTQYNEQVDVALTSPHIPGGKLIVPSAMTTIAPSWRISALLDARTFEEMRKSRDAVRRENSDQTAEGLTL